MFTSSCYDWNYKTSSPWIPLLFPPHSLSERCELESSSGFASMEVHEQCTCPGNTLLLTATSVFLCSWATSHWVIQLFKAATDWQWLALLAEGYTFLTICNKLLFNHIFSPAKLFCTNCVQDELSLTGGLRFLINACLAHEAAHGYKHLKSASLYIMLCIYP